MALRALPYGRNLLRADRFRQQKLIQLPSAQKYHGIIDDIFSSAFRARTASGPELLKRVAEYLIPYGAHHPVKYCSYGIRGTILYSIARARRQADVGREGIRRYS